MIWLDLAKVKTARCAFGGAKVRAFCFPEFQILFGCAAHPGRFVFLPVSINFFYFIF
jgi:hypothetical protein